MEDGRSHMLTSGLPKEESPHFHKRRHVIVLKSRLTSTSRARDTSTSLPQREVLSAAVAMNIPSSPPILPTHEIASSPPVFPEELDELPVHPSFAVPVGASRKRQLSEYDSGSSDPWFSEASSDDYGSAEQQPRRKRLIRGPWWKTGRNSLRRSIMAKRETLWNGDSGVWLGSDPGSDDTIESTGSSRQGLSALAVAEKSLPTTALSSLSPQETLAVKAINACVDTGREVVDLSGFALTQLSDATVRPLHQLIRHTHTDLTQPPSEDEFAPLTPSLQLFLSGNALDHLPPELFSLTAITVLSLRNNRLVRMPSAIGQLSNLKELNIAQNGIKWLPWEMLDLFHCRGSHRQITTRPNLLVDPVTNLREARPLHRPNVTSSEFNEHLSRWGETNGAFFQAMREWYSAEGEQWTMRHELELRLKLGRLKRTNYLQEASQAGMEINLCNEQLVYLASSAVRYFGVDGTPLRDTITSRVADESERYQAVIDPYVNAPPATATSVAPSLFELALRSLQANYTIQDSSQYPDDLASSVKHALQQAAAGAQYGNDRCSVCSRSFILARAEWMEFWFNGFPSQDCLTQETVLPFLRKACSWTCAKQSSELGAFRV